MKKVSERMFILLCVVFATVSCKPKTTPDADFVSKELDYAAKQLNLLREDAIGSSRIPRTVEDGKVVWSDEYDYLDWTEGFFPGTCWYLYDYTQEAKWKASAEQLQALFEGDKMLTMSHDLGFIFNASYANAYRLTGNEHYKEVVIQAAKSLSQRFNPTIGCLQSWNVTDGSWQSSRGWQFPVIIDNMMNLELLFTATQLSGDSTYWNIALSHANRTLKEHFRLDNSSFHVVDYDTLTGDVRVRQTAQGYAHESAWARGQAWGLYGYTLCYRFTKDQRYLNQAVKIADFILNNPEMPEDFVPYWDFDAPDKSTQPRDVSAAAIIASALLELSSYTQPVYHEVAIKILKSLSSPAYKANTGENHHFLLMHSTGSIPHQAEIDAPLNYADYYYVEALMRAK
jgi:uncharacterized protein YyaL (SSP411 family)